jgi:hypothetical protein
MVTFIILIINYEFQKLKYVFAMEEMFHLIEVYEKIQSFNVQCPSQRTSTSLVFFKYMQMFPNIKHTLITRNNHL